MVVSIGVRCRVPSTVSRISSLYTRAPTWLRWIASYVMSGRSAAEVQSTSVRSG
ncbi:MAG: hypothetical protein R2713_20700 [Ilumatobacteraceae bacterium]